MQLSIAICTWNRADLMDQTLYRFRDLKIPAGVSWELLIVNNNCTDHTDEVIRRHTPHLPIRRLLETAQGLSNARNCAVAAATGEFLIWTDDDVLVEANWLTEYVAAFQQWPDAVIFGGPVRPWFEGSPPRWLERIWSRVASAYAIRDFGSDAVPLSPQVLPFGANYALRREVQARYLYDPELGRKKTGMLGGEEVTVILQMLADGHQGRWVPGAALQHYIPRTRQTTSYLRGFYQGQGEFLARQQPDTLAPRLFGKPRWLWRKTIAAVCAYQIRRLCCQPEVWIESMIQASTLWGQLLGHRVAVTPQP